MEKLWRSDEDRGASRRDQPGISGRACRSEPQSSPRGTFMGRNAAVDRAYERHRRSHSKDQLEPWRSVKPSAQPTLVRTQHLPPPAKTAR